MRHALLSTAAFAAAAALGTAAAQESDGAVYSLLVENDFFIDTDKLYTNGFRAARYDRAEGAGVFDGFERNFARRFFGADEGDTVVAGFALGQNLYTPEDKQESEPLFGQRPYAAWLYGEYGIYARKERATDRLTLQLGVLGDWAQGDRIQNYIHDFWGDEDIEGWPNQIGETPGLLISYDRQYAPRTMFSAGPLEADVSPNIGATVGNVLISGTVGTTMRIGFNLPRDLGQARIAPGLGGPGWFEKGAAGGPYVFAGALGRVVGYDITLDGRPFAEDIVTADRKTLTYDLQAGIAVPLFGQRLAFSYVRRGEEFENQGAPHEFGSLSLAWRF